MWRGLPFILIVLTGCAQTTGPPSPRTQPRLVPGPAGVVVGDSGMEIGFGRAQAGAVDAATRLIGEPPDNITTNPECGAGPLTIARWDGFNMLFQDGAFRGWVATSGLFIATNGIAPGMTRAQIGMMEVQQTSLGPEFQSGGIFGLIEGDGNDAPVTTLWAGVTCFFR